jgi:hypothetical protein
MKVSLSSFNSLHYSDLIRILKDLLSLFIKANSPKWSPVVNVRTNINPFLSWYSNNFKQSTSPFSII